MSTTKIYVTLEGGIVQSVSTNDPALVGVEYITIDYDTEGADADQLSHVIYDDNGKSFRACIGGGDIDAIAITIEEQK